MGEFLIYQGTGVADRDDDRITRRAEPPPWRVFDGEPLTPLDRDAPVGRKLPYRTRTVPYQADEDTVRLVNVALHLRRPLLVTGHPGTGKSTLAYAVAHELRLGPVLRWSITSRSTLTSGLYHYDAVGRIEEANARAAGQPGARTAPEADRVPRSGNDPGRWGPVDIGRFLRLGPLGTAFAPYALPRVLLVDEIDKSDIDLPNELLDVFEEGEYAIPELQRIADLVPQVRVRPADNGEPVTVNDGRVRCREFPFIVLTSNGEREFPPAFLRRCVQLDLAQPDERRIEAIVRAHLGDGAVAEAADLIADFLARREQGQLATDQLLNAVYLLHRASGDGRPDRDELIDVVLRELSGSG
ncbi:AAA family ATPase [Micromonospora sagamiensis]|uniref:ATPase family protein associated with various cellular activities (AAA) n=1 Tax=Micromonospora sagamiensis TaxID=47875 RepID=A0A562WEU3_9ACTN|nr:MoxR family ATPase [Micromonospora sagamiensis]TWJ28802.1 ATPase family protein associated with various cellular activities (AAA) [Micromonospora sagamiensis]BCL12292.1 ATPase AAA [Micromonospora sagamiensis]